MYTTGTHLANHGHITDERGPMVAPKEEETQSVVQIQLELIDPNPFQQRKEFDAGDIKELAASIASGGLLQPVSVRPHPTEPGRFQLISGERRHRAHRHLKRKTISAIVREDIDDAMLEELALIENVQRKDLLPIEEANGYQRLLERHGGDLNIVVKKVGKSRGTVEDRIALLGLDSRVQAFVDLGSISLEQAKVLLDVEPEQQYILAKAAISARMDVNRLKGIVQGKKKEKNKAGGGGGGGDGPKQVTFAVANKNFITMSDVLERLDLSTCKHEDLETLKNQLGMLVEQIKEDVLPKIDSRIAAAGRSKGAETNA